MFKPIPGIALYRQVKEQIQARIKAGVWRPGDQIPNEEELARQWGVSRGTMRQAIQQLCTEGPLVRYQGRGTFVTEPRIVRLADPSLLYRLTLDEEPPRFRILSYGLTPAPPWVAESLGIAAGTEVFALHRLRLAGDPAVSIKALFLPLDIGAEALDAGALERPLIEIVTDSLGLTVSEVQVTLEPIVLTPAQANTLSDEPGSPGLRVAKRHMDPAGIPLVASETVLPARFCRYQFTVPVRVPVK